MVIILATLLANLLVLVALARGRPPVRARRHLILSLTACNVLLSLTVTLLYAISTGSNQWVFGSEYCLACGSFYIHLNGTAILHLTAIALSSFLYTKHSLPHSKPPLTHRKVYTLVLLWILPAVTSYPPLLAGASTYIQQVPTAARFAGPHSTAHLLHLLFSQRFCTLQHHSLFWRSPASVCSPLTNHKLDKDFVR